VIGASIRARTGGDVDRCARLLLSLDPAERYPAAWPGDVRAWLAPEGMVAAWVAEDGGEVVAHVALRAVSDRRDAVLTRLWVAPGARRRGVARALCDVACARASELSLCPALEVGRERLGAIAMYERSGWIRVSSEPRPMADADGALAYDYRFRA
jgi:ribosomal protein S18 acetylase RimI-like enzyme